MEIFWTVIAGVSVFVLGQIILQFILTPILDFRNVVGQISHKVKFHSNIIVNSGLKEQLIDWSSGDMRDLSSQLESKFLSIPLVDFFSKIKLLPSREKVRKAAEILILFSNAGGKKGFENKNLKALDELKQCLSIVL